MSATRAHWMTGPLRGVVLSIALILTLISGLAIWRDKIVRSNLHDLGAPRPESPDQQELEKAAADVSKRYSADAIRYFFWSMAGMYSYLTRVDERAKVEHSSLRISTELTLLVNETYRQTQSARQSHSSDQAVLIPLIMTTKGRLLDDLQIRDAAGNVLPTLSQYETRGLLAIVVQNLFRIAKFDHLVARGDLQSHSRVPGTSHDESVLMWRVIQNYVCRVGRARTSTGSYLNEEELDAEISRCVEHPKLVQTFSLEWLERIKSLCLGLANNYVIVVELPIDTELNQIIVTYDQLLPIASNTFEGPDRLRARLGLFPNKVDAPLSRALEAQSYHFQLEADPGMYVFDHHLERMGTRRPVRQADLVLNGLQQYARVHYEQALGIAHLYMRRQGEPLDDSYLPLKTVVEFRQIPPGVLGAATALSAINTIVITFFAVTLIGFYGRSGRPVGFSTDVPALLIALPAFVAAFVGNWADRNILSRTSLRTYGGLLLTMLVSFVAALVYLLDAYVKAHTLVSIDFAWGTERWRTDVVWLSLAAGSFILTAYLAQELRVQSRYYLGRLRARVTGLA
jgi:hypothetical protein